MKRSLMTDGYGIPLDRVLAPASRHDSPLLAGVLDKLADLGPLPDDIRVHLDAGYDSQVTRDETAARKMTGQIAHKGEKAPIRASQRWPSNAPMPGITPSTACSAATNGARKSLTPSSTSPTRSLRSVA
jgi:IS5 family transposase